MSMPRTDRLERGNTILSFASTVNDKAESVPLMVNEQCEALCENNTFCV